MPKKPITIPTFTSAGQEADWWESREGKRIATEIMGVALQQEQLSGARSRSRP